MAAEAWHPELDDDDRRRPVQRRPRRSGVAVALWSLILVLLLLTAGIALALYSGVIQVPGLTARTPPPAQPAPAAQATAAIGQQATAQQPQQPQPTVIARETYGDWIYTCVKLPASDETRCGIVQQLSHNETGSTLFLWRIAQDGKGGLIGEWETPTGVVVGRGILLDAGTEQPIAIPFQACTQTGCVAVANLAPDFVESLSRAEAASAVIYPIGGQGVRLMLSVNGLTESLVALGFTPGAQAPMGAAPPPPAPQETPAQ